MHRAVETWSEAGAISFNAVKAEHRSHTVTTLRLAEGLNGEDIRRFTREDFGLVLGGGLGPLEGHALRIGHMGAINESMILGCLATLETAFIQLGIPHGPGGTRAAIEHLAAARSAEKSPAAAA